MGAYKFDGVDDQAIGDGVLGVSAYPGSIGVVYMPEDSIGTGILAGLINAGDATRYFELQYLAADDVSLRVSSGASGSAVTTTGAGADDVWETGVGVGILAADRHVYRGGVNEATTVTSRTWPTGMGRIMVGRFVPTASPAEPFDGHVAYVFVWDVGLTDADAVDFEAGTLPQEADIVHGYDFTTDQGSTINDLFGNIDLTVTGAVYDGGVTPSPSFSFGSPPADDKFFPFI